MFAVMKLQFGFVKVRYRGLKKNANRLFATCALVNLSMVRKQLLRPATPPTTSSIPFFAGGWIASDGTHRPHQVSRIGQFPKFTGLCY